MYDQGVIKEWNDERGFGFITSQNESGNVFVHVSSFPKRERRPVVGDVVSYNLKTDARGRFQADSVSYIKKSLQFDGYLFCNFLFMVIAAGFLAVLALSSYYGYLPFIVCGFYIIISAVTFFAYTIDKSAAENREWRLPEDGLHVMSIIGGWPGALLAQVFLRHKSRKRSFRIVFWATVFLNTICFGGFYIGLGGTFLRNGLGLM